MLVVDDIVNTGLCLNQTAEAVRAAGGLVAGAGCLVTRGNFDFATLAAGRFAYLLEYTIPAWPAAGCPLCSAGIPINVRYAHGADYLALQAEKS